MSTVLQPVGPEPGRVYWIRRLVVLAVVVVVLVVLGLVVRALASGGEGSADPAPVASGEDEAPAEDEPEGAPGSPTACSPEALTTILSTDTRSYPAESAPVLTVAVTNSGEVACTVDAGTAVEEVLITSGSDRIWSSADCEQEPVSRLLLLDPGDQERIDLTWQRERSDESCTAGLADPRPGTYTAVATVLGTATEPAVFDLG